MMNGRADSKVSFQRLAPALTAVFVFAVGVWAFRPYPVGVYMDDGVYAILAKAIATGHGLRNLHLPGMPLATHFPPGYPLLLSAVWRVDPNFPQNIELFLLLQAALVSAIALGTYAFARRILGWRPGAAVAISLVATLSRPLMSLGAVLWSEVFTLAILLPLLVWGELVVRRGASLGEAVLLGLCAGALGLVRTQTALIVPAICIVFMLRRQWRPALVFVSCALCVLMPWQLWTWWHADATRGLLRGYYGSYGAWFAAGLRTEGLRLLAEAIRLNAGEIAGAIADRVAPWPIGTWRLVPVLVAAATVIFGGVRMWKRAPITVLFGAGSICLVLVWPFLPWRFVWGLWPLLLLAGTFGAAEAVASARPVRAPAVRFLPVAAAAALSIGMARAMYTTYHEHAWSMRVEQQAGYIAPLVRWVRHNTQPGDVLVADDEPLVYLFTGRQAMPPVPLTAAGYVRPRTQLDEAHALAELLRLYPAKYVVTVVPTTRDAARTIASAEPGGLREIQPLPNGAAFEVERR